jgi:aminopeptidase S
MTFIRLLCALTVLLIMPTGQAWADTAAGSRWQQQVAAISVGVDSPSRANAIITRLDALSIGWHEENFEHDGRRGRNLIADLGGPADAPLLLVGAHYDKVAVGHGATDNASGVAAVLELAQAFKQRPLAGHRVQLAFWDLEENGLLGSSAWVSAPDRQAPALYVNFDVFGWGDTLWMMSPEADSALVRALRKQAGSSGLGFSAGQNYPPTDHLSFLRIGWPAVSFSLVGGDEIDGILTVFGGGKPAAVPKVMQVIHSPRDTIGELDARHIDTAVKVIEQGLREWAQGRR